MRNDSRKRDNQTKPDTKLVDIIYSRTPNKKTKKRPQPKQINHMNGFICVSFYLTMSEICDRSTYRSLVGLIDIVSLYESILFNKLKFRTQAIEAITL